MAAIGPLAQLNEGKESMPHNQIFCSTAVNALFHFIYVYIVLYIQHAIFSLDLYIPPQQKSTFAVFA